MVFSLCSSISLRKLGTRDGVEIKFHEMPRFSLFFIKNISNYLALYYITFLRNGVLKDLRDNIYENLINQPINYYYCIYKFQLERSQ